jgi:hypothetical protein
VTYYLFRMEGCRKEPLKFVGRTRARRMVAVCAPTTVTTRPGRGSSKSHSKVEVKLFLSTPLRHVRK